jgi:hypothetical protein
VPLSNSCRNGLRDRAEQSIEVRRQVRRIDVETNSSHTATDVDTNCTRNDCAFGRDHTADCRSDSNVSVGHERDVADDDRKAGRAVSLFDCTFVDVGCPRVKPWSDLFHVVTSEVRCPQ